MRSITQDVVALSSAEAELYGIVKAVTYAIGIKNMMADWGITVSIKINTDASAALGTT